MKTTRITATALAAAALGAAASANAAEFGNVVSATPVLAAVGTAPRVACDERYVQSQPSGGGALIGALIGGVLGNQIGHGIGRAAATSFGAVAGAAIGNHAETAPYPVRDCRTVGGYENRVVGYDVVYEYRGQRYTTRTARDPGPRVAIATPAAGRPVPPVGAYGGYDGQGGATSGHGGGAPSDIDPYSQLEDPRASYYAAPPHAQPHPSQAPAPAYYAPAPGYAPAPTYYPPAPAYYAPAPAYYAAPPVYYGPALRIGIHGGGHRHNGHHRHWR